MKKNKEPVKIQYKFYKIINNDKELLKTFFISIDSNKKQINNYILKKEADLLIINDMLGFKMSDNFKIENYLPIKPIRNRNKKTKGNLL